MTNNCLRLAYSKIYKKLKSLELNYSKMAIVSDIPINILVNHLNPACCAESDNECPICFHDMLFPKQVPCCKRRFHEDCLNKWYAKSPTCPNCRASKNKNPDSKHHFVLQLFYNYYNREFRNEVIPKTVGVDKEIDDICKKFAYYGRAEFSLRYQGKMINELAKLYKSRQAQRFNEEIEPFIVDPPKKRGRPIGSKNKPKDQLDNKVKKESKQEKEKRERKNRIVNMSKEYNINVEKKQQELNEAIEKKKEEERLAKEAEAKKKEEERLAKEELESNPIKMAGNAALKRAIINILDKGRYGK